MASFAPLASPNSISKTLLFLVVNFTVDRYILLTGPTSSTLVFDVLTHLVLTTVPIVLIPFFFQIKDLSDIDSGSGEISKEFVEWLGQNIPHSQVKTELPRSPDGTMGLLVPKTSVAIRLPKLPLRAPELPLEFLKSNGINPQALAGVDK